MKPVNEEETKLKKYLSMKNLGPQINTNSREKFGIHPVNEVRASMEFGNEYSSNRKKKKDNIFFEEFSENNSKQARDSNKMSATSFKKVNKFNSQKVNQGEKELSSENKSVFSKSYSEFSGSDNRQPPDEQEKYKRKGFSQQEITTNLEKTKLLNREIKSNKRIQKIGPKRTSIMIDNNDLYHKSKGITEPFVSAMENIHLVPPGKDFVTFTEIKKQSSNLSNAQLK
jgi:hypothetical protein